MLNKIENFIFDLDGTIVNSSQEVLLCFKKAFQKANCNVEESRFTSNIIGPPLKQIIELLAPELKDENKITEIVKNFRQIYDYDENDISVMYEGMFELLKNLRQGNKKLFIATFKPKIPTMRILDKFQITNLFEDIYTIDKFDRNITKIEMIEDIINKYQLKEEETIMLGDAPSDMIAGTTNKVKSIGALWGYGDDKTELKKTADVCVQNIEELKCLKLN